MIGEVNGLELLREEMEQDNIQIRINAIHRLKVVVQLMNAKQFEDQMVPYLNQLIQKEEDEVLFALAGQLGGLSKMVPNSNEKLLPLLEKLCQVEETVVRNQAVNSLTEILSNMTDNEVIKQFMPVLMDLCKTENNFMAKVSAIHLMCSVYPRAGNYKDNIRSKFNELCHEETPMVKKATAIKIGDFAKVIEKQHVVNEIIQQFKDLSSDDQDAVRVNTFNSLNSIVKILTKDLNKTHILPVLIQCTEDKSWKIRHALALNFPDLVDAFGKEISEMNFTGIYSSLLRDNENEVRIQAIKSLYKFINQLQNDKVISLIQHLYDLMSDPVAEVKNETCNVLCQLFVKLGKDQKIIQFLPKLKELCDDDNIDVRISNLKAVSKYVQVLGIDQLPNFIPALKSACAHSKWRVRLQAIETVLDISVSIKNFDEFIKSLENMVIEALKDKVYEIRHSVVNRIKHICAAYESKWLEKRLLAKLSEQMASNNYIMRISATQSLEVICGSVANEYYFNRVMPHFLKAAKDPISNVRIVFCKASRKVLRTLQENQLQQVKQQLNELISDSDKDVQFFAKQALS